MKSRCSGAPMSRIIKAKISTLARPSVKPARTFTVSFSISLLRRWLSREVLFSVVSLNLIYQFWVHTEHIQKLGPWNGCWSLLRITAYTMVGTNSISIVTMGASLLSGTACSALFRTNYRRTRHFWPSKPLKSWNPLWANIHVYWRLMLDCWHTPGLLNKLSLPFRRPGWRAPGHTSKCQSKQYPRPRLKNSTRRSITSEESMFSRNSCNHRPCLVHPD